jgi:hypothetical protein
MPHSDALIDIDSLPNPSEADKMISHHVNNHVAHTNVLKQEWDAVAGATHEAKLHLAEFADTVRAIFSWVQSKRIWGLYIMLMLNLVGWLLRQAGFDTTLVSKAIEAALKAYTGL